MGSDHVTDGSSRSCEEDCIRAGRDVAPASDPSEADFPEPRKRPSDWWEGDHVGASSDRPVPAAEGKGGRIRDAPHPSVHNRVRSEVGGIHVSMASELATRAVFGAMSALGRLVRKNKPVMVLEPNRDGRDRKQALFVMMPGAFKDPSLYRPLAEAVQKECEERNVALYVTLSALPFGLGTEGDAQSEYQAAVEHVKTLGFDPEENQLGISDKVYVGGHSWGGAISRKVGFDRAQGVVLMGASCKAMSNPMGDTVPQGIAEWHKPMLLVAAELDGQARLPYAALDWQEAREASASADEPDVLSAPYKCVAVVEDMNHSQFCDGMPNIPRGDIGVAVQQTETVQRTVARIIADFIAADQLKDPACIQRMAEYNSHTGALVETYLNAFKEAVNKETAVAVQVHIAQEGISKEQISAYLHKDQAAFVFSKPELLQAEAGTHCRVQYFVEPDSTHRGGRRNSRNRCSPTLWVKSKSAEAIAAAGGSEAKKLPHGQRAAEFNKATYARALGMVSPKARERFEKYGRPLRFVPDYMATSGQDWVKTPVLDFWDVLRREESGQQP
eukprot:jgi/Pico_ML_1/52931/g3567.t1